MTPATVPQCIAIIMDGNRRYAKERGLPSFEGHRAGYEKIRQVMDWAREWGVANVIVFAFSTENWNRAQEEVGYLMKLFRTMISEVVKDALRDGVRLRFIGQRGRFEDDMQRSMDEAEKKTAHFTRQTLAIALSYGGRAEIVDAVRRIPLDEIATMTEEKFASYLWTHDIPDPDIIIRASGEQRLSGFLTWQSVYSELFFTKTYWPAFTREEFDAIIDEYSHRERRLGK